jgi:hypothetical protein
MFKDLINKQHAVLASDKVYVFFIFLQFWLFPYLHFLIFFVIFLNFVSIMVGE